MPERARASELELPVDNASIGLAIPEGGEEFPPVEECFARFDWASTDLGLPETWALELHLAFSIIHHSEIPAALYVGKDWMCFFNQQYAENIVRSKHPRLYGAPGPKVYAEVEGIEEMIGGVFREGKSFTATAFCCYLERTGRPGFQEESFFDFTMGPLFKADGVTVHAVLNFANDVTQHALLVRRIAILADLATRGARAQSVEGVCHSFTSATRGMEDMPWMAVYVAADITDHKEDKDMTDDLAGLGKARSLSVSVKKNKSKLFRLVSTSFDENLVRAERATSGDMASSSESTHENMFVEGESARNFPAWLPPLPAATHFSGVWRGADEARSAHAPSPSESGSTTSSAASNPQTWPFLDLSTETPYIVLSTPSPESPSGETIIIPITTQSLATGDITVIGILVAGLNRHRLIDDEYVTFYRNVTKQLESGIISGRSRRDDRLTAEALRRLN